MEGILALEDGTILRGRGFGHEGWVAAEMCFNTSMTGYEEILTDPSYRGQVVALTCPEIGNTGINPEDEESDHPQVAGLLVRRLSRRASNWRERETLEVYLRRHKVPALEEVDTRCLTRKLRTMGAMKGVLANQGMSAEEAVRRAKEWPGLGAKDYVAEVTCRKSFEWDPKGADFPGRLGNEKGSMPPVRHRVAAIDCGMKRNILRQLRAEGIQPVVFPAQATAEEILKAKVDGVFLSNGPGDPSVPTYVHQTVRDLVGKKPIFGICLGHQMLAHALGGKTYKLKFGHRGGNQPVQDLLFNLNNPLKNVTMRPFYMDDAEISNAEYRQFVNWVRDSIAHTVLGNTIEDEDGNEYINWKARINWKDPAVVEELEDLFLPENQRVFGRQEWNTARFVYNYKKYDYTGAVASQSNRNRNEFVESKSINIYPDTLV
ncbi:MAG: carbamoyl-phosphate synthase small subunit, partial [Verrucomicrobia bacterium]|nr:carbamoyl-phosphate synthase small subunit [Verrucomicrobiota bacterium]